MTRAEQVDDRADVRSRLRARLTGHELSPAHRRVVDYLIDNAPEAVFLSSPMLSATVGISQPTTTRLARVLGYRGFSEMQDDLRRIVVEPARRSMPVANRFQAAVDEAIETLTDLRRSLDDDLSSIRELGGALARSTPLIVLAGRSGAPAANHFAYFASRIHTDVRLLNVGGTTTLDSLLQARQAGATWVLCFVLPRYPTELLAAARYAKRIGLRVATVTDETSAMVAEFSDVILHAATSRRLTFTNYTAPMMLAGILLQALCDAAPQRARIRLTQYERMAEEHRVYHGGGHGSG